MIWASYCIIISPFWWGGLPAIMKGIEYYHKGWFDRVFVAGLLWDYGKFFKTGMMKGKKA